MARIGDVPLKVKMTQTKQASPNGYRVEQFYEGQVYILSVPLVKALAGSFVVVKEEEKEEVKEEKKEVKKNAGAAPKNRMASVKENK